MFRSKLDLQRIPKHIGIIMDGNGRFALKKGLVRHMGHSFGIDSLRKIMGRAYDLGVETLTVYAFSTENWKRPKEEIAEIERLLLKFLKSYEEELAGRKIKLTPIGDITAFSVTTQLEMIKVQEATKNNKKMQMIIGLNYGGRAEILRATKRIANLVKEGKLESNNIDEKVFEENLWTKENANIDLIIRTSGEFRTSNFLPYQSVYSEYWFTKKMWPQFSEKLFDKAIAEYQKRMRRMGGV